MNKSNLYTVWIRFLDSESLLPIHDEDIELGTVKATSPESAVKKLSNESTTAFIQLIISGLYFKKVFTSGAATAEFRVGVDIYGNTAYRKNIQ